MNLSKDRPDSDLLLEICFKLIIGQPVVVEPSG